VQTKKEERENMKDNTLEGKTILYDKGSADNSTVTIRTVTAGKTYYLVAVQLVTYGTADGGTAYIEIGAAGNRILRTYTPITATYQTSNTSHAEMAFPHPIPLAAGQSIRVISGPAGTTGVGQIVGWEE